MDSTSQDTSRLLLDILRASPIPLSTRNMSLHLRLSRREMPGYKISGLLRDMLRDGSVEFKNGRWAIVSDGETVSRPQMVSPPSLSAETATLLGLSSSQPTEVTQIEVENLDPKVEHPDHSMASDRWQTFRKLISYYRQCIRYEGAFRSSAFQNEINHRFVYLRKVGSWYPKPGLSWRSSIPLGPHLSPMLGALPSQADDQALVVGYPVQAYHKENDDEPDVEIITPIFFFTVEHAIRNGSLIISSESPRLEVNLEWIDHAFSRNPDRQRNFLSACGFINRWASDDEIPGLEKGETSPSLENLNFALAAFMPEKLQQPLTLTSIEDHTLTGGFKTGIYNRAVLMLAKKTSYHATLLKELAAIEKAPDKVLERTALNHIFFLREELSLGETPELLHEAIVADNTLLNAEQRRATASLLTHDITVVTGPPGTGKSQVVSSTTTNARLHGQTVLFASRNHKAIDSVIGRLTDEDGRSLMVRTNSKTDPNLKFTFVHAIREMLAEHYNDTTVERLERAKEELLSLLKERGKNASCANQVSEMGGNLGELMEKMSYLAKELPESMILALDTQPELLSSKAIQKVTRTIQAVGDESSSNLFIRKLTYVVRSFTVFPWYLLARRRLSDLSESVSIPFIPTPKVLKNLLIELPYIERAIEYARLRIECRQYENKLAELPPFEQTTTAVAKLSDVIRKVTSRAVSLDLESRRGVPPEINREKLDGLRAALNAMRTGLDDGAIRSETNRELKERIPQILQAFPCWAVTNLSAGSRIPFIPNMFDLAIIDEASQSDIPSAIPILFRARRAGVIGDPFQLTHTSKLSTAKDTMLRREVGITRVEDVRYAYTENSLYNLFAGTRGVEPIFLRETYRSAEGIADYSSFSFYNGQLRVATDAARLLAPKGVSMGIHWTEVEGGIQSGGGSGCYCREEVDEVVRTMRVMLLDNNFRGTVGVVTPFRHQASRIKDALFESDSKFYDALVRAQAHVDTAHGFQGDERDVIVFSLCGGPNMPRGSHFFLRDSGNLFNVAVSRARAVLHVIGNKAWAQKCGVRHIEQLASPQRKTSLPKHKGPWHPHESPWEEKLYNALVKSGLEPRPQFSVASRRLDMALIRHGDNPFKIDIEVDGDCHRNPDGSRKLDDTWRDIQLMGLGWKVMRFWTYQLREDMTGCVGKILKEWNRHE